MFNAENRSKELEKEGGYVVIVGDIPSENRYKLVIADQENVVEYNNRHPYDFVERNGQVLHDFEAVVAALGSLNIDQIIDLLKINVVLGEEKN